LLRPPEQNAAIPLQDAAGPGDLVTLLLKTGKQPKNLQLVLDPTSVPLLRHLQPANPAEVARDRPGLRWSTRRKRRREEKGRGKEPPLLTHLSSKSSPCVALQAKLRTFSGT
jgi:hypothetical protein